MEKGLKELVEISQFYGSDPAYVIAGGGNTSYKNDKFLWIKASGTSLASITEQGFARMDREKLDGIAEKHYSPDPLKREAEIIKELFNCVADNSGLRPSVETSLHNLIEYPFVVHTHPTLVNGLMCSRNSAALTRSLFGEDTLLVEYTDPGYVLFKLVEKRIKAYRGKNGKVPKVIFLENHGVFVSAETTKEVINIYSGINAKIAGRISRPVPSTEIVIKENPMEEVIRELAGNMKIRSYYSGIISEFTSSREAFSGADTAFSPDNIVYCKAHYLFTKPEKETLKRDYTEFRNKNGYPPKVIAFEKGCLTCIEENENSLNTVYEVFLDIMKISYLSRNFGGPRFMTPEQIEFIDNWEVENYRRKVAKAI